MNRTSLVRPIARSALGDVIRRPESALLAFGGHLFKGGALILPDRQLYNYLTQRIGNYRELSPYFPVYQRLSLPKGVLVVMAVSHDETSEKVALIPKGMDGNSLRRKAGIQK